MNCAFKWFIKQLPDTIFSLFFILAATDGAFENVDAVAAAAAAVAADGDSAYLNCH